MKAVASEFIHHCASGDCYGLEIIAKNGSSITVKRGMLRFETGTRRLFRSLIEAQNFASKKNITLVREEDLPDANPLHN